MEKINFRFLNYKKYDIFTRDLSLGKVREDAIVFIQDKLRIWARGKEYICDEKNRVTIDGEDIILTDKDGNQETFLFTTKDDFEAFSDTVNQKLEWLLRIIDDKYVLKQDVYYIPEGGWSSSDIVSPGDTTVIDNGSGSNHGSTNRMVTLTIQAYERLVEINGVNPDTYYFTYEGEDEAEGWVFGDTFPVIFSDKTTWLFGDKFPVTFTDETTWGFGDKFPVILTNGTAEGLGEFPINLT